MSRPNLIVIADDRARASLSKAIADPSVSIIDCFDAAGLSSLRGSAVLIDINLHDVVKVRSVKDNLPLRTADQCRMLASIGEATFAKLRLTDLAHRTFCADPSIFTR
jgi:hypothetical protein